MTPLRIQTAGIQATGTQPARKAVQHFRRHP